MSRSSFRADSDPGSSDDLGGLRFDAATLGKPRQTDEGYLIVEARIAKPGLLKYRRADGSVSEYVPAETLHDVSALETLRHKPVVIEHPTDEAGNPIYVTPDNIRELAIGEVGSEVRIDDDGSVIVPLVIKDRRGIAAVRAGLREVSPGYKVRTSGRPTETPFGRADDVQIARRYNHVALTRSARGGRDIHLRADSLDAVIDDAPTHPPTEAPKMALSPRLIPLLSLLAIRFDGLASDDEAISLVETKIKGLSSEKEAEKSRADSASGTADTLKAEVEALKVDASVEARLAWFADRSKLVARAEALQIDSAEIEKLDLGALKRAVVMKSNPAARADASDDYYDAAFDMIAASKPSDPWRSPSGHRSEKRTDSDGRTDSDALPPADVGLGVLREAHSARFR